MTAETNGLDCGTAEPAIASQAAHTASLVETDVAVIGAGPAGLATACQLGSRGWRTVVIERAATERRKLCGEFLSGDGFRVLQDLGATTALESAGCPAVDGVAVGTVRGNTWACRIPGLGRGCSRVLLGRVLEDRCRAAGVTIFRGLRAARPGPASTEDTGSCRACDSSRLCAHGRGGWVEVWARLVIAAAGQPWVARAKASGRGWIAFAVHGTGAPDSFAGRVELYALPGGYAGLCPVEGGMINLCAMMWIDGSIAVGTPLQMLEQVRWLNPLLKSRLHDVSLDLDEGVCVSGIDFDSSPTCSPGVVAVGDCAAAPVPLLGQGMAAALRGGQLLAGLADRCLRGEVTHAQMLRQYRTSWRAEFGRRFWIGRQLQRVLMEPAVGNLVVGSLQRLPGLGRRLVLATRGPLALRAAPGAAPG